MSEDFHALGDDDGTMSFLRSHELTGIFSNRTRTGTQAKAVNTQGSILLRANPKATELLFYLVILKSRNSSLAILPEIIIVLLQRVAL